MLLPSGDMNPIVRASTRRGFPAVVAELGGDAAALLERFRIAPDAAGSDTATMPAGTLARLLEAAAAELACPDLGLRLAERQDTGVLGPLAIALENAASLDDARRTAERYLFARSAGLGLRRVPDPLGQPGTEAVLFDAALPGSRAPQLVDYGLGLLHRIVLLLHGGWYGLRTVLLPHAALAPVARYADYFGADVRLDAPSGGLRVPARLLDAPLPGRNPVLGEMATDYLDRHFAGGGRSVAAQVHIVLGRSLGAAAPTLGAVARLLGLHPRTLQRRLAAEDTSFDEILDAVRRDAAERLITTTELPFTQVAAMVGLAGAPSLTRAARRWFGAGPRELRHAGSGASAGSASRAV
jgi:AraC-like DNA-binding protein